MDNSNKKSTIIIAVLILIILGLVGYIGYDKIMKNENNNKEESNLIDSNNSNNVSPSNNVLSEEEAMSIGKELWDYAYFTYWRGKLVWGEDIIGKDNIILGCENTPEEIKKKYSSDFQCEEQAGQKMVLKNL